MSAWQCIVRFGATHHRCNHRMTHEMQRSFPGTSFPIQIASNMSERIPFWWPDCHVRYEHHQLKWHEPAVSIAMPNLYWVCRICPKICSPKPVMRCQGCALTWRIFSSHSSKNHTKIPGSGKCWWSDLHMNMAWCALIWHKYTIKLTFLPVQMLVRPHQTAACVKVSQQARMRLVPISWTAVALGQIIGMPIETPKKAHVLDRNLG
jgi:hypothetical protein